VKRGCCSCLGSKRCRKHEREKLPRATIVAKLVTLPVTAVLRENPVPAETASSAGNQVTLPKIALRLEAAPLIAAAAAAAAAAAEVVVVVNLKTIREGEAENGATTAALQTIWRQTALPKRRTAPPPMFPQEKFATTVERQAIWLATVVATRIQIVSGVEPAVTGHGTALRKRTKRMSPATSATSQATLLAIAQLLPKLRNDESCFA